MYKCNRAHIILNMNRRKSENLQKYNGVINLKNINMSIIKQCNVQDTAKLLAKGCPGNNA